MDQKKIDRINELYKLSKQRTLLTEQEKQEQTELRNEYRAAMRLSLVTSMDNTVIVTPDGKKQPLKRNK